MRCDWYRYVPPACRRRRKSLAAPFAGSVVGDGSGCRSARTAVKRLHPHLSTEGAPRQANSAKVERFAASTALATAGRWEIETACTSMDSLRRRPFRSAESSRTCFGQRGKLLPTSCATGTYKPRYRMRFSPSLRGRRATAHHVSFRPDFVGYTPRCGRSGWRCRPPGCDPEETFDDLAPSIDTAS